MNPSLVSVTTLFSFIFFWNPIVASFDGSNSPAPYYIGDVAINCGYHGNSTALDGRQWFGDTGSRSVISKLQPKGKSRSSTADHRSLSADPIPYMTARISATPFHYTFQINPGQKFIRLHFYPSSYRGFEKSQDFFTVKAGPFTLLRNFSASLAADAMGVKYLIKEFCLNVEEDKVLNLAFSSSHSTKNMNLYAFVNGIEIISMPTGLYYTPDGDLGPRIVGQNNRYLVDNSTALEMVQRLSIGGSSISPVEDFGMFRRWTEDSNYLLESNLHPVLHLVHGIKYTGIPVFTAPLKIYHTSWELETGKNGRSDKLHNFTWKIPVDLGFGYLVRLHFYDFGPTVREGGQREREFNVLINNQIAETKADVIRLSGGIGVPIYRDYMVILKGDKDEGKFDLLIALQSSDELVVGLLHGLEIFKLSSLDNNLASPNPDPKQVSTSWNLNIQNSLLAFGRKNAIVTGITTLLILLNLIVFKLRQIWEETSHEEKDTRAASSEQSCRRFSLAEIISATQNFSDALLIGRGGFGNVYKGFICGGSEIVAVKRLKSNSKQGAQEFWTEIETLSRIRHIHLVSLIGYCNSYQEMILVYEYMSRGTLADNLYKIGRNGKDGTALTWEQRLKICIGAARGLDYLHTGIEYGVIHRDVKDSNILLDGNLVAKVSDFGLSKLGQISESQSNLSTKVKGTFGYLDPNYIMTHKATRKTDVYAFGVLMLVVLCGRPAVDRRIPWEPQSLLFLFRESMTKGDIGDIIDPSMQGEISPESLNEFIKSVENCLHPQPQKRPTMSQVVTSLEYALERQQVIPSAISDEAISIGQPCEVENMQSSQFGQFVVPPILGKTATVISPLEEGNKTRAIQTAEVKTRGEVFQSREKNHTYVRKPLWCWPWEARRSLEKITESGPLVSSNSPRLNGIPVDRSVEFSYEELASATNDFSLANKIGQGGFGSFYYGELRGEKAAIKQMDTRYSREFLAELKVLTHVHHLNLIRLIGYCVEGSLFLVYEYIENGTLTQHLRGSDREPLPWAARVHIALDSARGLEHIHEYTVPVYVHRNIKSASILIDKNFRAKVFSFGLTKMTEVGSGSLRTRIVGTFGYMPPEYVQYGEVSPKIDVYAFGVVLYELISAKEAIIKTNEVVTESRGLVALFEDTFNQPDPQEALCKLVDPRLGDNYPTESVRKMAQLAKACTHENPLLRPSMRSIVAALMTLSL